MGSLSIAAWSTLKVRSRHDKYYRAAEVVKQIVDRGQRDRWDYGLVVKTLAVDCQP